MRYVMAFRIGRDYRMITSDCETTEVEGQKEALAMRLERDHDGTVICTSVIPCWSEAPRKAAEEDDDDDQ